MEKNTVINTFCLQSIYFCYNPPQSWCIVSTVPSVNYIFLYRLPLVVDDIHCLNICYSAVDRFSQGCFFIASNTTVIQLHLLGINPLLNALVIVIK